MVRPRCGRWGRQEWVHDWVSRSLKVTLFPKKRQWLEEQGGEGRRNRVFLAKHVKYGMPHQVISYRQGTQSQCLSNLPKITQDTQLVHVHLKFSPSYSKVSSDLEGTSKIVLFILYPHTDSTCWQAKYRVHLLCVILDTCRVVFQAVNTK